MRSAKFEATLKNSIWAEPARRFGEAKIPKSFIFASLSFSDKE